MAGSGRHTVVRGVGAINDRLGARQALRAMDYFRCLEYALAAEALDLREGLSLLDMGCGSGPFPLYLSEVHDVVATAFDLDPAVTAWQRDAAGRLGLSEERFRVVTGDSRQLPFAGHTFDRVLNLSSIEHIRGDGDSKAAAEMARVMGHTGRAVLSIPFGPEMVEVSGAAHVATFERRYDETAVAERIIRPSGLAEIGRIYFGEPGLAVSRIWFGLPAIIRFPIRRLAPALAGRFLHRLGGDDLQRAVGMCLVLSPR
jgi:SAM-dependent methyltransferase